SHAFHASSACKKFPANGPNRWPFLPPWARQNPSPERAEKGRVLTEENTPMQPSDDGVSPINIVDEMKTSYLDYAMSVIVSRALPDVRDGLKPVHRRILYAAQEGGFVPGRPYKKSAKIVGDVMGNYHPHGDSAIYDALARMTQDWSLR